MGYKIPENTELITQTQASKIEGAPSQPRINVLIKNGKIKSKVVSGKKYVIKSSLIEFIKNRDIGKNNILDNQKTNPYPNENHEIEFLDRSDLQEKLLIARIKNEEITAKRNSLKLNIEKGLLADKSELFKEFKSAGIKTKEAIDAAHVRVAQLISGEFKADQFKIEILLRNEYNKALIELVESNV